MWYNLGLILIGLGVLVLISWGVKDFFMTSDTPLLIRITVGAVGAGILILITIAIKDRISKAKTEDFKEVEN
ncbi:MAG: hypothetical protein CL874_01180 [Dehalococcoidales bacterium]|jgi:hypothetical protein|nr:hypothetical protein [Dehalococcoidales bacterium]MDP6449151.1 hypothetical protein [Dehalococcoidales bacterium]MDP6577403.1 hypothetical protein [Dehalococcoidales bacterium]MDP6824945.1 hypothetical protein [Dehalococcoidales bacterium]|tara:strand:- start:2399 stop:2614 length:216 start_codon:yes stop_codon:yes gene_type:complete